MELEEQLYKNPSRFIQSTFVGEKKQKDRKSLLKDLNSENINITTKSEDDIFRVT